MSETRYKLREAKYFLERMQENASSDRDTFTFNLSAFLSAARSVRQFLMAEYKHVTGFNGWWGAKRQGEWPDPNKNDYRDVVDPIKAANVFFEDARNQVIHQRLMQPRAHFGHFRGVMLTPTGTVSLQTQDDGESQQPIPEPGGVTYYFTGFEDKDVLTLCAEYVARLDALVDECEAKFG
jgi:hypothetical protein